MLSLLNKGFDLMFQLLVGERSLYDFLIAQFCFQGSDQYLLLFRVFPPEFIDLALHVCLLDLLFNIILLQLLILLFGKLLDLQHLLLQSRELRILLFQAHIKLCVLRLLELQSMLELIDFTTERYILRNYLSFFFL